MELSSSPFELSLDNSMGHTGQGVPLVLKVVASSSSPEFVRQWNSGCLAICKHDYNTTYFHGPRTLRGKVRSFFPFSHPLSLTSFLVPPFLPYHFAFLSSFFSLVLFDTPLWIREKLKAVPGNLCCIQHGWVETRMLTWLQRLHHGTELTGLVTWPGLTHQVRETLWLFYSALHCSGSVHSRAQWLALSTLARPRSCNKPEWAFLQCSVQSPGRLDRPT